MDAFMAWELVAIVVLIAANGFFATAETAIVGADREKLAELARGGDRRAQTVLDMAGAPQRWLPIVQAGISFVATLAAVLAGVHFTPWLMQRLPGPESDVAREIVSLVLIVLALTLLSVTFGELAPKRIAAHYAVPMARFVARPLLMMTQVARPVVWLTARVTDVLVALVGVRGSPPASVSFSEIESAIERGTAAGIVEPLEQKLALEALRLGDQQVRQIMRPRVDIDAADVETPSDEVLGVLAMAGFSRIPVYEGDLDHIIGIVHLKDVLRQQYLGWELNLRKLVHPALFVSDTLTIDRLLALFRERREHMAIVVDEFGGTRGMVTVEDVLRELFGDLAPVPTVRDEQGIIRRDDGNWLVDGKVTIAELLERVGRGELVEEAPKMVNTVAGLVLTQLNRVPRVGETTTWHGLRLEVVDMDGQRIDRLLVSLEPQRPPPS